ARMIPELLALDTAVSEALTWTADRDDTLIVVTADHEAGGLMVSGGNGVGQLPSHTWTTQANTDERVPYFIWGETSITAVPLNLVMYGVLKQATSAVPQNCDLRLHTAVDTPQPRPVEDPLTLSWTIHNQSVWRTEGAVFSSTLPAELLVAESLSSTLPITPTGTVGQWLLPPLAPQEGLTLTLTAVVTANVPVSTALVSTAVVSGTVTDAPAYTVRELQAITLTVANIQPITRTDLYFFAANQTQEIPAPGLLGNDFDWNGDEITAVLSVGPPNAETFALQPDGSFVYTPRPGFAGLEIFQYLAYDPHGGWGIGEVRFYVGEQILLPLIQR
ncbi:MAG: alkaline phosphatase, partial [Anaerolineales bacterium]|nr:alkaline phosphatase [Anaerolineales bacterium]